MADCTKCGAYTKYNGGLCSKCYDANNAVAVEEPKGGLNDKEHTYRYNMIKGRIAETLIQELFLSLGFNVFRYGMENTIPGIMELLKGVRSDVANDIKRMPDFVVQNTGSKDVYFLEVKFRASGEFKLKDLPANYPYSNAYIVVVSKKHIKCVTVKELEAGQEVTPSSHNYLGNRPEFAQNKAVIIEFCNFAIQFFESV